MRWQALGLAGVSLVFCAAGTCCGVGDYGVLARYSPQDDCYYLGCPIAVGAEARLYASWTYTERGDKIIDATMEPSLGELELFHGDLLVRPTQAGTATLRVTLASGDVLQAPISTDALASVSIASALTPSTYPAGPPLAFAGSTFDVHAVYASAMKQPMLGHGLEAWSVTGGTLAALPLEEPTIWDTYIPVDPDNVRRVVAGAGPKLTVSVHPTGTPLEVDIVPGGSTQRLDVAFPNADVYRPNDISLPIGRRVTVRVTPYAADGRAIFGIPAGGNLSAATDNTGVASVRTLPETRELEVEAVAAGTTQLTVTLDGVTRRFNLDIY